MPHCIELWTCCATGTSSWRWLRRSAFGSVATIAEVLKAGNRQYIPQIRRSGKVRGKGLGYGPGRGRRGCSAKLLDSSRGSQERHCPTTQEIAQARWNASGVCEFEAVGLAIDGLASYRVMVADGRNRAA